MVLDRRLRELQTVPFVKANACGNDFLIIDGVTLAQGEVGKPLTLNIELSTYYRVMANGS
jgi:hypothetical protein